MIELQEVTKIYPRKGQDPVVALDHLSLSVSEGSIHGIVGESGAGKSTLIRCLTALEHPTSGSVQVAGKNFTELNPKELREARREIGMVFQGANLLSARTAGANVEYPLKIAGVPAAERKKRISELFKLVGLEGREDSYPAQLSGGQRQRVGIARAIATNPSVLLADEPTSALDMETTEQILDLIKNVQRQTGVTVVVITHEMPVVRKICDSVTLLEAGRIVESKEISQAVSVPNSPLSLKLIPRPKVENYDLSGKDLIDIFFTAHPQEPAGAKVIGLVAQLGADIAAGLFETVGKIQVSRIALTVPSSNTEKVLAELKNNGIFAEVRS